MLEPYLLSPMDDPTPTCPQKTVEESRLNKSFYTTETLDITRRHPFIDYVMGVQLPLVWKGLNIDRYDKTTDPDEHTDIYTTHMSLYTSNNVVLCRVLPTSLKEGVLS